MPFCSPASNFSKRDNPNGARNGFAPSAALPTIVDNRLTYYFLNVRRSSTSRRQRRRLNSNLRSRQSAGRCLLLSTPTHQPARQSSLSQLRLCCLEIMARSRLEWSTNRRSRSPMTLACASMPVRSHLTSSLFSVRGSFPDLLLVAANRVRGWIAGLEGGCKSDVHFASCSSDCGAR